MMEKNSAKWEKDATREQKKYLFLRTVFFAAVFMVAAALLRILGSAAGASENGWLHPGLAALAGGYFPGLLGGIWKLYREGGREIMPEKMEEGGQKESCRIIPLQRYTAARMKRQAK